MWFTSRFGDVRYYEVTFLGGLIEKLDVVGCVDGLDLDYSGIDVHSVLIVMGMIIL